MHAHVDENRYDNMSHLPFAEDRSIAAAIRPTIRAERGTGIFVALSRSMPVSRRGQPLHVTIVSDNPETLDGLGNYLRGAGAIAKGTRALEDCAEMVPVAAAAVVLFPDDFEKDAVFRALEALGSQHPNTLPVLVTRDPKQYQALPTVDGRVAPLVVPKPVWGWTLLDAIRARLDSHGTQR